jgi:hypothetical protein
MPPRYTWLSPARRRYFLCVLCAFTVNFFHPALRLCGEFLIISFPVCRLGMHAQRLVTVADLPGMTAQPTTPAFPLCTLRLCGEFLIISFPAR